MLWSALLKSFSSFASCVREGYVVAAFDHLLVVLLQVAVLLLPAVSDAYMPFVRNSIRLFTFERASSSVCGTSTMPTNL